MKRSVIIGVVSGIFFLVSYLVIDLSIFFSLLIAFFALLATFFCTIPKKNYYTNVHLPLKESYEYIEQLKRMIPKFNDKDLKQDIGDITNYAYRILKRLEETPEKMNQMNHFLDYYLPITLRILGQYEKIEDQKLTSNQSKQFEKRIFLLVDNIKFAFETQLNQMYSGQMSDMEADMKVFETILKTDGLLEDSLLKGGDKDAE